jgi:FlaA1/EpsC-like NDP-sugar epimerase
VTRQQNFFGRIVAATDLAVLFASYLAAHRVRLKLWELAYPVLPIGSVRSSAWILTVMFPAWLIALRYFRLYSPTSYKSTVRVIGASFKAQVLASALMLNAVFIIRGFDGVSRPLLALIIMFSFLGLMSEKLAILFLMRHRWRLQRRSAVWRVLLVGSQADAENYLELVREHPEWNLKIVDVVSASPDGAAIKR